MDEKQTKIDNKKKSLENAQKELASATAQNAEIDKKMPLLERELELRTRNAQLIYEGFKPVRPTWEYELNQEYLDNLLELNKIAFLKVEEDYAKMKSNLVATKKNNLEQLQDSSAYIELLQREIEMLEKGE